MRFRRKEQSGRCIASPLLVIILALLLDWLFGDPPNRYHPVAWMGRFIGVMRKHAPTHRRVVPLLAGGGIALVGSAGVWGIMCLQKQWTRNITPVQNIILSALLLKMTFSLRGLNHAAQQVEMALNADDLPESRRLLSWHLVSRDTSSLNTSQIAAAAVESIAENTSDGIIAPLFFYALGGLPAAYAYRYAQTCDSMLGYRDTEREWLGKIPARFDDLLNLIPSRLTAFSFMLAAFLTGDNPELALNIWRRDGQKTASPNAGQPMSAAAGALGVELEKVGHYRLGAGLRPPNPHDIQRMRRLMLVATGIFTFIMIFIKAGIPDDKTAP